MNSFKDIRLEDKTIFDKFYHEYNPEESELTFTNIFMWREAFGYKFRVINDLLCCISVSEYNKPFATAPIGNFNGYEYNDNFVKAVNTMKEFFDVKGFEMVFKRVSKRNLDLFEKNFSGQIKVEYCANDSDYVYKVENMINLHGKKYHKKRNHISKFMREYGDSYEYIPLEEKYMDNCYKIMEDWCKKRDCVQHQTYGCERPANIEVLKNFNYLNCKGCLIKVNGKFEAMAVGERLNSNTVVIHVEKANNEIDGLYTIINRDFLVNEWSDFLYVNREQDLGIEGIRKSKLSYHPDLMIDKYTVQLL